MFLSLLLFRKAMVDLKHFHHKMIFTKWLTIFMIQMNFIILEQTIKT